MHIPHVIKKPENGLEPEKKEKIDETIKLAKLDLEKKSTEELIDEVYKFAPTEFQKEFREFRKYLDQDNTTNALLKISDLFEKFPKDEFEELHPIFLRLIPLLRYGLEKRKFPEELRELTDLFWDIFCKKLAILYNENVPFDLLPIFEGKYKEGIIQLRDKVREVENLILDDFAVLESNSESQSILEKHLEKFLESKGYL
jgi:hypothetical protein